ncbi:alpha/beta hydrolase [Azospirillum doebereinerae]|uniref:Alpha/beta hydrolase n=2 Tax=Azospirillum doebereinerae TaxID=92933 RepID=A0A433J8H6_9PROT|nr:alpha/beta hydrolase [Azospirillum doebereinerae]
MAQSPGAGPTAKDRLDQAVGTVTGSPLAKADADMKHVLDALADLKPKPIEGDLSAAEARQQPTPTDAVMALLKKNGKSTAPEAGIRTENITLTGAAGSLPARVYIPENANKNTPLPVVVYYHGGGWVIADLDTYDASPRAIAKQASAIVVSAHYRQAPESKFPAAHDDAFAAYQWVLKNAKSFGGDPAQVAVMGESAGGNLAINTAIKARDANIQLPVHQVLVYPVAGVDMNTQSYKDNADAKPLNKPMMEWFVKQTVRNEADLQDPRLDLVGRADLRGLPPTTVITAEIDPLRDDGRRLADKLRQASVPVDAHDYAGVTHEFFGMGSVVADAKTAEGVAAANLTTAFQGTASGSSAAAPKRSGTGN